MRVTDGRTDGQNYDSQDRASIAASRGKNGKSNLSLKQFIKVPKCHNAVNICKNTETQ